MGEMIVITPNVVSFLQQLVWQLHSKGYFGFEEDAHKYVDNIRDAIYNDLPNLIHYPSPKELEQHGKYYVKINTSKRTTWYVFFDKMGNRYLIEFITNNHAPQSAFLNHL